MTEKRTFIIGGTERERRQAHVQVEAYKSTLDKSKKYRLTIEPYRRKRTTSQNSLYWSWMTLIADETGNDKDDIHEFLLNKFCPTKVVMVGGEEQEITSTKYLDTKQMSAYMDRIPPWAGEFNISLPLPENQEA